VTQGNWQRSNDALENHLQCTQASFLTDQNEANERRSKNRFAHRLPARVWGVDIEHEAFGLDCAIENISSAGVYLTIPCRLKSASEVSLIVHLLDGPHGEATAAIRGKVSRIQPLSDERYGVAIEISDYQFL
jgi:23S rRNA G2445 N2-methylase RlmL